MNFTKKKLQEIIKEELAGAHLDLLNENPAMLSKYLPMIQKLGPQIQSLGPDLEAYGPVIAMVIDMVKGLDQDKLEQAMALIANVGELGKDD
jgi:hypothetical protein|tara:strand:+ start:1036 stop:1311 length:276 start_codon:yes stop_codon:yes gene_type:complete